MTNTETRRLLAFSWAKAHAFRPAVRVVSRRSSKNKSKSFSEKERKLKPFRVITQRIKWQPWSRIGAA